MAHFVPSVTPQLTLIPDSLMDREKGGGEEPQTWFFFRKNYENYEENTNI